MLAGDFLPSNDVACIMVEIRLMPDIRFGANGLRLLHQSAEIINRFKPRRIEDPFELRCKSRFSDVELRLQSFIVELDACRA